MPQEMTVPYQRSETLPNGRYAHRSWWNQRPNLIHRPGRGVSNTSHFPCLIYKSSQMGFSRTERLKLDWKNRPNYPPSPMLPKRSLPVHDALIHMHSLSLNWTETPWRQNKWVASFDGFHLQLKCVSSFSRKVVKMSWLNMEAAR